MSCTPTASLDSFSSAASFVRNTLMMQPLFHDNLADYERYITGAPVVTPADLLPGDVLASSWFPGSFITVTNTPRVFLGYVDVDYITEAGKHGTCHFRFDLPARAFARYLARRPA